MYIERNIELLEKNPLHWIASVDNFTPKYEYITSENDNHFFQSIHGEVFKTSDSFDTENAGKPLSRQMIIAIGVLSAKELNALYKTMNKTSVLIIIEPNMEFFSFSLNKNLLKVFNNSNVFLFTDNNLDNLQPFILNILKDFNYFSLVNSISFYLTDFYRNYEFEVTKKIIQTLKKVIRSQIQNTGNSVLDGLEGLENNLRNINSILKSKNPDYLKDKFKNRPAIVISAGPSLEKNIHYLKQAQNKAIIIAVDTIINKVLNLGIIPDFVTSVERVPEIYDYFYKDQNFSREVTLVTPPLIDSRVFQNFEGNWILPFRTEVSEYRWLKAVMGLSGSVDMLMGSSCAHVAFGLAVHLGASPIILIGQDLAYGKDEEDSHVSDTIYDKLKLEKKSTPKRKTDLVEGYYGEQVKSTDIWIMFKQWFELKISEHNLNVINATEGGAKINHTIQMPFIEALNQYCKEEIPSIYEEVEKSPAYDISLTRLKKTFESENKHFKSIEEDARKLLEELQQLEINSVTILKDLKKFSAQFDKFNSFVKYVTGHPLLIHNMQGAVLKAGWDFSMIDETISVENLEVRKSMQIKFIIVVISTCEKIIELIDKAIDDLTNYEQNLEV